MRFPFPLEALRKSDGQTPRCPAPVAPDDPAYHSALAGKHPTARRLTAPCSQATFYSGEYANYSPTRHPLAPPHRPPDVYLAHPPVPAPPPHAPPGALSDEPQFPPVQCGNRGFLPAGRCGPRIPSCHPTGSGLNPRCGTCGHQVYH